MCSVTSVREMRPAVARHSVSDMGYISKHPGREICRPTSNGCEPMRTFGMYLPDAACVPTLGYGRYPGDNEAGVS